MKAKLVIPYWALDLGGIQTRIVGILEAIFYLYDSVEVYILVKRKTTHDIKIRQHKNLKILYYSNAVYHGEKLRFAFWIIKTILSIKPTHILTFLNRFSFIVVLSKFFLFFKRVYPKIVLSEEIYTSNYLKQKESFYWRYIVMLTYRFADKVYVLTQAMKNDLGKKFSYSFKKKLSYFLVGYMCPKKEKETKKYDAVFAGRLSPEKRVSLVLKIAQKLKEINFQGLIAIAGDGILRKEILEEIQKNKLGNIVKYLGYRNDILKIFSQSKLLLLPSKNEGLPMVILEANSVGLPVAVTPFEGSTEIITDEMNGFIFSDDEYVNRVTKLLASNDKSLLNLAISCRDIVIDKYSIKNLFYFVKGIFN